MSEIEEIFTKEYQDENRHREWWLVMGKKQIELMSLLISGLKGETIEKQISDKFWSICRDADNQLRDSDFESPEDLYEDLVFFYKEISHYLPTSCKDEVDSAMLLVDIKYHYRALGDMIQCIPLVDKRALAQMISKLKELCLND